MVCRSEFAGKDEACRDHIDQQQAQAYTETAVVANQRSVESPALGTLPVVVEPFEASNQTGQSSSCRKHPPPTVCCNVSVAVCRLAPWQQQVM